MASPKVTPPARARKSFPHIDAKNVTPGDWIPAVSACVLRSELPSTTQRAYLVLRRYAAVSAKRGRETFRLSMGRLARDIGRCPRVAKRTVADLRVAGLLLTVADGRRLRGRLLPLPGAILALYEDPDCTESGWYRGRAENGTSSERTGDVSVPSEGTFSTPRYMSSKEVHVYVPGRPAAHPQSPAENSPTATATAAAQGLELLESPEGQELLSELEAVGYASGPKVHPNRRAANLARLADQVDELERAHGDGLWILRSAVGELARRRVAPAARARLAGHLVANGPFPDQVLRALEASGAVY